MALAVAVAVAVALQLNQTNEPLYCLPNANPSLQSDLSDAFSATIRRQINIFTYNK